MPTHYTAYDSGLFLSNTGDHLRGVFKQSPKADLLLENITNPRLIAVRCLAGVVDSGRSLSEWLPLLLKEVSDERARGLAQELCYGVLRWYLRLDALAGQLLERPLRNKDRDLHMLILVGLYQLGYLNISDHAAVNETVESARQLGKKWAVKLVNGVLRAYQRKRSSLDSLLDARKETRFAHPSWLLDRLQTDWPQQWDAIAEANNRRPPMTLRVNCRRQTRDSYQGLLAQQEIPSESVPHVSHGLTLLRPVSVKQLPGFADGWASVQDGAAQLAQQLLEVQPGMRVLDACAAPGGKTAHLLEATEGLAELTAVDIDPIRLARVAENLSRLGLTALLVSADVADTQAWWDGRQFDRILLDAPCSATGVIRRHPDIKVLRRNEDIEALVQRQLRLLNALWPLLAPRGMLLYVTCSVLGEENNGQVLKFLTDRPDAQEQPICSNWGRSCQPGRQILPGEYAMDGFYYVCLVKA